MKRLLLLISVFLLVNQGVFATSEYIEYLSGEQDDGSIYLESYEDYLNAIQGVDDQEIYKQEYINMISETITSYDMNDRTEVIKAKVLSIENTKDYYSYDGYGLYKIIYQPITVEILEGNHKGETFEVSYILTADSYENIKVAPIKENQKINVVIQEEDNETYVYATTVDASVDRVGYIIFLVILAIIFIIIYLGKKSFKLIPGIILLADILFLIFVPEILAGRSILWLTIVTSVLYMIVESTLKVGLNSKMIATVFSVTVLTVVTTFALVLFGNVVNFSGITYEITNIIETFPKGTIDFYILYLSSFILMNVIITTDIVCRAIKLYSDESIEASKEKIKEYTVGKLSTVVGILFVIMIPKYLNALVMKYTFREIVNSEMLLTDIVRILLLIISSTVAIQITEISHKLFVCEDKVKK